MGVSPIVSVRKIDIVWFVEVWSSAFPLKLWKFEPWKRAVTWLSDSWSLPTWNLCFCWSRCVYSHKLCSILLGRHWFDIVFRTSLSRCTDMVWCDPLVSWCSLAIGTIVFKYCICCISIENCRSMWRICLLCIDRGFRLLPITSGTKSSTWLIKHDVRIRNVDRCGIVISWKLRLSIALLSFKRFFSTYVALRVL